MKRLRANVLLSLGLTAIAAHLPAQGARLAWALHYDPKTFDPAMVADEASETVRVLTGGVLERVDRRTLKAVPQLAESWSVSADGHTVTFHLRSGLAFSNGAALTSADVVRTLQHILDPATASPKATLFPHGTVVNAPDARTVVVHAATRIDSPDWAFDEISIEPGGRGEQETVTAGPFYVTRHQQGQFVELARNPHFWRAGYPRVASIRLDVLANREQEMMRLLRVQYQFVDPVPAADVDALSRRAPGLIRDLGPSLELEEMWFNESPRAPIPEYRRAWFQNRAFRVAVSETINRADLARIAFSGHATPADGFLAPAGGPWRNTSLHAPAYSPTAALRQLKQAGWQVRNNVLYDAAGHAVEFSIITNAGNEPRARMLALIQQDLAKIGIQVTLVQLDFPSLIERLTSTQNYDACLLGTTNASPTPESTRDVWRSSSPDHTWNPSEKTPATAWEVELDHQLAVVDGANNFATRKRAFDRMQQIVADEQPILPLVYRNRVSGICPRVTGLQLSVLAPPWWNIEELGVRP